MNIQIREEFNQDERDIVENWVLHLASQMLEYAQVPERSNVGHKFDPLQTNCRCQSIFPKCRAPENLNEWGFQITWGIPNLEFWFYRGPNEYPQWSWIIEKPAPDGFKSLLYCVAHECAHAINRYQQVRDGRWINSFTIEDSHNEQWAEIYINLVIQFQDKIQ